MSAHKSLITFQPVPVRSRHDGWTIERQIAFLDQLTDCGSVSAVQAGQSSRRSGM